jgi:hypothetical protein
VRALWRYRKKNKEILLRRIIAHALWHLDEQSEWGPFVFCSEHCRQGWVKDLPESFSYRSGISEIDSGDQCDRCCIRIYDLTRGKT